ncbi:Zn-ribbon domain-containing OB-fold protein [Nocardia sp. bgisy134]|uniref:Zn-ribbon domain-containing OB-fold protein n=1 Tax=Nocardia sp. bgisy134 TaxID=3413789 RepID=UPI003D74C056
MTCFLPEPTPQTAPYWAGVQQEKLMIQRGKESGTYYFYPRSFNPAKPDEPVEWVEACGHATLESYVITMRPTPGVEVLSPVIALVRLDEGPVLMTNIVEIQPTPDQLKLDMRLSVRFRQLGSFKLPVFGPIEIASV